MPSTAPEKVEAPAAALGPHESEKYGLQCLEVWGGSGPADLAASVRGADLYVHSRPHAGEDVGGDIYYLSSCAAGTTTRVVLADVAGHGASVEPVSRALRNLMRRHISNPDMTRFAQSLSGELMEASADGRFATALLAGLATDTGQVVIVNAGHPPPLWYRAREASWGLLTAEAADESRPVQPIRNLPLGIIEGTEYEQFTVGLEPGDLVLLYSDAVIESRGPDGRMLGPTGLVGLMGDVRPDAGTGTRDRVLKQLVSRLETLRGGEAPDDDLTLVMIDRTDVPPPPNLSERVKILGRMLGMGKLDTSPETVGRA